jgi:hypothetical protein
MIYNPKAVQKAFAMIPQAKRDHAANRDKGPSSLSGS